MWQNTKGLNTNRSKCEKKHTQMWQYTKMTKYNYDITQKDLKQT